MEQKHAIEITNSKISSNLRVSLNIIDFLTLSENLSETDLPVLVFSKAAPPHEMASNNRELHLFSGPLLLTTPSFITNICKVKALFSVIIAGYVCCC